ncbi:hypothetical protein ACLK1U_15405 [Escherichia coli]
MRFVDEYRTPEQVMQFIELVHKTLIISLTPPERPIADYGSVAVIAHAISNSASTSYCRKTLSLSTVQGLSGVCTADG